MMHLCNGACTQRSTHELNKSPAPNSSTSAQKERENNSERSTEEFNSYTIHTSNLKFGSVFYFFLRNVHFYKLIQQGCVLLKKVKFIMLQKISVLK